MDQTLVNTKDANAAEQARIDFKMVTFTLAGKDYGIDIMKVKEISKASKFTFVPNAAPFVTGVYNLRGDIISVIDLRKFFNLSIEGEDTGVDNMIILRLDDHVLAIIVDTIDKVVGIASEAVQPPHPLFGDINIKYISGVVENNGRLYVILDVERIFGTEEITESQISESRKAPITESAGSGTTISTVSTTAAAVAEDVDIGFIEETLVTFLSFHASPVNQEWIRNRYPSWKKSHGEGDVQLTSVADAEAFLRPFASPFSGTFWNLDYIEKVASFLDPDAKGNFHVWNPGCGGGYETYSIAAMIKKYSPNVHLRILAHDNDLIRISTAPGLSVDHALGAPYDSFLAESTRGQQFSKELKDAILFEYHDITHDNTLPKLDLVVMRDTVSYLPPERQSSIFALLDEVMKSGAVLLLGTNEVPFNIDAWKKLEKAGVVAYKKK